MRNETQTQSIKNSSVIIINENTNPISTKMQLLLVLAVVAISYTVSKEKEYLLSFFPSAESVRQTATMGYKGCLTLCGKLFDTLKTEGPKAFAKGAESVAVEGAEKITNNL